MQVQIQIMTFKFIPGLSTQQAVVTFWIRVWSLADATNLNSGQWDPRAICLMSVASHSGRDEFLIASHQQAEKKVPEEIWKGREAVFFILIGGDSSFGRVLPVE